MRQIRAVEAAFWISAVIKSGLELAFPGGQVIIGYVLCVHIRIDWNSLTEYKKTEREAHGRQEEWKRCGGDHHRAAW